MVNYLQRFLFRWKYAIVIFLMISAIAAAVSIQINRWVPNYALSFSQLIAQQFQTRISFSNVYYRFPDFIIFKDVRVLDFDGKRPLLESSKVTMNFTFPLFSSATPLHYIILDDLGINFPVLRKYLERHGKKIYAWAKTLPKGKLRLLVPNGQIYLKDYPQGNPISYKVNLNFDQGRISAQGSWDDRAKYNFELDGTGRDDGFDLDKFTVQEGRTSINFWGSWHANNIDWKGFIFYDKFYILDIDGHVRIQDKNIILKQLSFSIDGDGVGIKGQCSKEKLFQCDADMTYWQGTQHHDEQIPFKNINLHLHAQNTLQGLSFNGAADLNFILNPIGPVSLQNAHLEFKDLKAQIINGDTLKLKIKQTQNILFIQGKEYNVPLEDVLTSINYAIPYQKTVNLSARMFNGYCHGRFFLDTSSLPWQIKSQGSFDEVSINQGLLSGAFQLQSGDNIKLWGNMDLRHGIFNDTQFQAWLSKTLQMPSLNQVTSADLSCQFKIDGKSKTLENLKLHTQDLVLKGDFYLDEDDLVSSRASVQFSQKLLSESDVGRHIIGLVRGAWTLPFEFRLSGNVRRMNFQWDNSPLKDKVRQHMFSFFERIIDERMDAHPYYKATMPNESVSPG